ncbi:hypothetical protein [Gimesia aquarii]|nr:hypothetical protein [Gimesia aquarii]
MEFSSGYLKSRNPRFGIRNIELGPQYPCFSSAWKQRGGLGH